jgi:SAM-dependent methyltransferase
MTQLDAHDGRSWDKYSAQWGELEEAGLGVEWGTEELTQSIFDNCLRPHLGSSTEVLEIGPGGGKYSVLSAPLCQRLVIADVSTQMLERARRALAGQANVEVLKLGGVDLSGLPDESIDFAFSIDVFVHQDLEDVYGYVRELHRVLRPGGKLVLHFANLGSRAGWGRFHRIADYNRAMRRQVGRINFVMPYTITTIISE